MIAVSSDSSDSEDEDDGQEDVNVGNSESIDAEAVPDRRVLGVEDSGKLLESPPAIPRQKNIQQAITSSPLSIPRKPSLLPEAETHRN